MLGIGLTCILQYPPEGCHDLGRDRTEMAIPER